MLRRRCLNKLKISAAARICHRLQGGGWGRDVSRSHLGKKACKNIKSGGSAMN